MVRNGEGLIVELVPKLELLEDTGRGITVYVMYVVAVKEPWVPEDSMTAVALPEVVEEYTLEVG